MGRGLYNFLNYVSLFLVKNYLNFFYKFFKELLSYKINVIFEGQGGVI